MDQILSTQGGDLPESAGPARDFQEHLRLLEREGLLLRITREVNKDTELHPLVRWQFMGGMAEADRRAFLFTNVIPKAATTKCP